ncbi:MAG: uL15 family ribosomal protein, partial [Bacteroidales bacterium]|nr:uL15 family ribosomal protein [Bacteroidales bacterium]
AISKQTLIENGLVSKKDLVKILGNGDLKAKLDVTANAFSKSAKEKIEAAKGTATVIK